MSCPVGLLATKANAIITTTPSPVTSGTVAGGATAVYTCNTGFRISPATSFVAPESSRTVTCDATSGVFQDLAFECVRKYLYWSVSYKAWCTTNVV